MSWPDPTGRRRIARPWAAVALALTAAGCGFSPLYGERGAVADALAQVRIAQIADRTGQQLRNHLLLRLSPRGQPNNPAYVLKVRLVETGRALGVRRDDVATRANLEIDAAYVLERAGDGKALISSSVSSTTSYNILDSEFGTLKAEANARARAVHDLSDALTTRLAVYLRGTR